MFRLPVVLVGRLLKLNATVGAIRNLPVITGDSRKMESAMKNLLIVLMGLILVGCNYEPEFADLEELEKLDGSGVVGVPGGDGDGPGSDGPGGDGDNPGATIVGITDEFNQNSSDTINKVDIVWVVDDSGSMGDDQQSLATNFSAFIDEFITRSIDFKMGITTTDLDKKNGRFVHDLDLLTQAKAQADENQFKQDFTDTILVGTRGSGREKAFDNMVESTVNPNNNGFFRDDALLAVIIVTDEPEQGADFVQTYADQLLAFKGDRNNYLKVYPIHRVFGDDRDQRFVDIATLTNGFTADIQGDFFKNLRDIGGSIVNLIGSFVLTQTPVDPTGITIEVDGVFQTNGWSYKANANSIVFEPGFIPAEGAVVKVFYEYEQT